MTSTFSLCLCLLLSALAVLAQTITVTDAAGNTIIEVVTIDPQLGVPATVPVQTIPAGAGTLPSSPPALPSSPTSATTPTQTLPVATIAPPEPQQGPVGAPAPIGGPAGPITYTYTTTDANGDHTAIVDVFTPTEPASTPFTPTGTGTILDYSGYLSSLGTHTVPVEFSSSRRLTASRSVLATGAAVAAGLAGGFAFGFVWC